MPEIKEEDASKVEENLSDGFVKIFRSIRKHWLWQHPEKLKWWIDILMEVNFTDKTVLLDNVLLDCKRGQSLNSLETWSKRWRVDKSKVRRFLQLLKNEDMILLENLKKTTRLTVCKYESYNDCQIIHETQLKRKRNAVETQLTPNNKDKKDKKENKDKKFLQPRENIKVDEDEDLKLEEKFGRGFTDRCYNFLSDYKIEKSYTTKSDYLTILRWVADAVKKQQQSTGNFTATGSQQRKLSRSEAGQLATLNDIKEDYGLNS